METRMISVLLHGALCAGLASCPLFAAEVAVSPTPPDSGVGGFYSLVLGLYAALFGGMAVCYGLVRFTEMVARGFQGRHTVPLSRHQIRHAA